MSCLITFLSFPGGNSAFAYVAVPVDEAFCSHAKYLTVVKFGVRVSGICLCQEFACGQSPF